MLSFFTVFLRDVFAPELDQLLIFVAGAVDEAAELSVVFISEELSQALNALRSVTGFKIMSAFVQIIPTLVVMEAVNALVQGCLTLAGIHGSFHNFVEVSNLGL